MDHNTRRGLPSILEHGGDTVEAEALFGRPSDGWLDLSTGINPHPYPIGDLTEDCWLRLPGSESMEGLRRAAADCYGVPDPALVAPAPGAQSLIQLLPRLMKARAHVSVLSPTFNEHAHAWKQAGHHVSEVSSLKGIDDLTHVVVVVNPNNPDGRLLDSPVLLDLAAKLNARGGWLVVDEAFADVVPHMSLSAKAGAPGLVVMRSFGKFFGLAGLRLGFALSGPELVGRFTQALGPWAVSGPAIQVATAALADGEWRIQTRNRLKKDVARLDKFLESRGLNIIGGTDLFRLVETPDAEKTYACLAENGVLVRRFSQYPNWLRFGLPGGEGAWKKLENIKF